MEKQSSLHAFYWIPKQLFTDKQFDELSVEEKPLYGMMVDRMALLLKYETG